MSPQWIPQNIQKRLLLYVLQQISLLSEIDLPNLEEVSLSSIILKDISIDPEKVGKLPGCNLRYGQIGVLELSALANYGGIQVEAKDLEVVVSPDFEIDPSEIANQVSFSLAQSTADLAHTVMFENEEDEGEEDEEGDEIEHSEGGEETKDESKRDTPTPSQSDSATSTKTSTLGGVMQRAVEIALSRIQVRIIDLKIKIVSELTDMVLEVDRISIDTINGSRNVNVAGVRLKTLKPIVNPGQFDNVSTSTNENQEDQDLEEREDTSDNENDDYGDDLVNSMVFTHEEASSIYMSATSKSFEKSAATAAPDAHNEEGIDNKIEDDNEKDPPIIFHMDQCSIEFEGLQEIANLEVIVGNINVACTPLTPTLVSIFQGITRSLRFKSYQKRRMNQTTTMNEKKLPSEKFPQYANENDSILEEQEKTTNDDVQLFKKLRIGNFVISATSALNPNGEFSCSNGINIVLHNISVRQKSELLLFGGIETFKIVRVNNGEITNIFCFEKPQEQQMPPRPSTPVSISSATSVTSAVANKADIRFEVFQKIEDNTTSIETTVLCAKAAYVNLDLQSLLILANFGISLKTVIEEFDILKTTIDNIHNQEAKLTSRLSKMEHEDKKVTSKDQFIVQTASVFVDVLVADDLKLQSIIFPIKYNSLQDQLSISKILFNSIRGGVFDEGVVTINDIALYTKNRDFKGYLHSAHISANSNTLPRATTMSSNINLIIQKIICNIPLKNLKFIGERISSLVSKFGELSSAQSNSLENSFLDERRSKYSKLSNSISMAASMYTSRKQVRRIGPGFGTGAGSFLNTSRFNLAKFNFTIKEIEIRIASVLQKFGDIHIVLNDLSLYQLKQDIHGAILSLKVTRRSDDNKVENFIYQYQDKPITEFEFPLILLRFKSTEKSDSLEIVVRNLLVEYYTNWLSLLDDEESIIDTVEEEIIEKVTPDSKSSASNRLDIRYTLYDCMIGLTPGRLNCKACIFVSKGNADFAAGINQFYIKCSFRNLAGLLIDDVNNVIKTEKEKGKSRIQTSKLPFAYTSPLDYYLQQGYIQFGTVNCTHVGITFNIDVEEIKQRNEKLGIRENLALVDIKVNSDEHQVNLCADSTNVILQLINDLKLPIDFTEKDRMRIKLDHKVNLLEGIEMNEFSELLESFAQMDINDNKKGLSKPNSSDSESQGGSSLVFEEEHFDKNDDKSSTYKDHHVDPVKININLSKTKIYLHDGYDWKETRKAIKGAVKRFEAQAKHEAVACKKSAKHEAKTKPGPSVKFDIKEEKSAEPEEEESLYEETLFQSIHVLAPKKTAMSHLAEEINSRIESNSEVSPEENKKIQANIALGKNYKNLKLRRSTNYKVLVDLKNVEVNVNVFSTRDPRVDDTDPTMEYETMSAIDARLGTVTIYDNVPSSTWNKILSYMNSLGEREIGTSMVRLSIVNVRPDPKIVASDAVISVSLLPLRLHVDQDTLDFLTRFFEFQDERFSLPMDEIAYIQKLSIGSIKVKLDYKPKKIDYVGLRSGKAAEFANFFILDGSSLTLPSTKLYGVLGMDKIGIGLGKAYAPVFQSAKVIGIISGVAPLRSVFNIGGGFKDLIAIPIAEYKKDGRLLRSLQKGTSSFAKTTGYELLNLGVKLASGTQVLLEQGEELLGGEGSSARISNRSKKRNKRQESEEPEFEQVTDKDAFKGHKSLLISSEILSRASKSKMGKDQYDGRKLYSYLDLDEEEEDSEFDKELLNKSIFLLAPSEHHDKGKHKKRGNAIDEEYVDEDFEDLDQDEDEDEEEYDIYAYDNEDELQEKLVSLYSNQPENIKQGLKSAYKSIGRNLKLTGKQLVNLKNELNESESFQESMATVLRNSPIILIRPMIGTTEALSKTLMGLSNKVDSRHMIEKRDKYRSEQDKDDFNYN
ncbi:ATG2 [[Candida] subhashii]|uniref:Autophagy-related protein 2 n=1 Tax=[Candida] subhashii TaxID=561895 RepID=A0A8J5QQU0_9ASCO|nr:ATG2 [[Candida] subhashii]KAG7665878.1 ATG2 [[Candida] subhashii]